MLSFICKLTHFLALEHLKSDEVVPELCIKNATKSQLKTNTLFRVIFWNSHHCHMGASFLGGQETQKSAKQRTKNERFLSSLGFLVLGSFSSKDLHFSKTVTNLAPELYFTLYNLLFYLNNMSS